MTTHTVAPQASWRVSCVPQLLVGSLPPDPPVDYSDFTP
jgi:hypothetical protein